MSSFEGVDNAITAVTADLPPLSLSTLIDNAPTTFDSPEHEQAFLALLKEEADKFDADLNAALEGVESFSVWIVDLAAAYESVQDAAETQAPSELVASAAGWCPTWMPWIGSFCNASEKMVAPMLDKNTYCKEVVPTLSEWRGEPLVTANDKAIAVELCKMEDFDNGEALSAMKDVTVTHMVDTATGAVAGAVGGPLAGNVLKNTGLEVVGEIVGGEIAAEAAVTMVGIADNEGRGFVAWIKTRLGWPVYPEAPADTTWFIEIEDGPQYIIDQELTPGKINQLHVSESHRREPIVIDPELRLADIPSDSTCDTVRSITTSHTPIRPNYRHSVTVVVELVPPAGGCEIRYEVSGTDGYADAGRRFSTSAGRATFTIPAAGHPHVRDDVNITYRGMEKRLHYSFTE